MCAEPASRRSPCRQQQYLPYRSQTVATFAVSSVCQVAVGAELAQLLRVELPVHSVHVASRQPGRLAGIPNMLRWVLCPRMATFAALVAVGRSAPRVETWVAQSPPGLEVPAVSAKFVASFSAPRPAALPSEFNHSTLGNPSAVLPATLVALLTTSPPPFWPRPVPLPLPPPSPNPCARAPHCPNPHQHPTRPKRNFKPRWAPPEPFPPLQGHCAAAGAAGGGDGRDAAHLLLRHPQGGSLDPWSSPPASSPASCLFRAAYQSGTAP